MNVGYSPGKAPSSNRRPVKGGLNVARHCFGKIQQSAAGALHLDGNRPEQDQSYPCSEKHRPEHPYGRHFHSFHAQPIHLRSLRRNKTPALLTLSLKPKGVMRKSGSLRFRIFGFVEIELKPRQRVFVGSVQASAGAGVTADRHEDQLDALSSHSSLH